MSEYTDALALLQTMHPGKIILYPADLAGLLAKSEKAVNDLISRGKLPFAVKMIGGKRCVSVVEVARWLANTFGGLDDSQGDEGGAGEGGAPVKPPKTPKQPGRSLKQMAYAEERARQKRQYARTLQKSMLLHRVTAELVALIDAQARAAGDALGADDHLLFWVAVADRIAVKWPQREPLLTHWAIVAVDEVGGEIFLTDWFPSYAAATTAIHKIESAEPVLVERLLALTYGGLALLGMWARTTTPQGVQRVVRAPELTHEQQSVLATIARKAPKIRDKTGG